jgi:hypothetical protein
VLREKITIRDGRVLDSPRGFDPATPRSGELAISPYDPGDDSCRSADDQPTILWPVPCSRFPQQVENAEHLHTLLHQAQAHPSIGAADGFFSEGVEHPLPLEYTVLLGIPTLADRQIAP